MLRCGMHARTLVTHCLRARTALQGILRQRWAAAWRRWAPLGGEEKEEGRKPPAKPSGELSSKAVSTYQHDSFDEEIFQLPGWSDDDTNYKYR